MDFVVCTIILEFVNSELLPSSVSNFNSSISWGYDALPSKINDLRMSAKRWGEVQIKSLCEIETRLRVKLITNLYILLKKE